MPLTSGIASKPINHCRQSLQASSIPARTGVGLRIFDMCLLTRLHHEGPTTNHMSGVAWCVAGGGVGCCGCCWWLLAGVLLVCCWCACWCHCAGCCGCCWWCGGVLAGVLAGLAGGVTDMVCDTCEKLTPQMHTSRLPDGARGCHLVSTAQTPPPGRVARPSGKVRPTRSCVEYLWT